MAELLRPTALRGDTLRYFGVEDGKQYRGHRQNLEGVKRHIAHMDAKVNGAPSAGNPREWGYVGSIPTVILHDWLQKERIPLDVYARNDGGVRQKFIAYLKREHPKLLPQQATKARPTVQVAADINRVGIPERPKREPSLKVNFGG